MKALRSLGRTGNGIIRLYSIFESKFSNLTTHKCHSLALSICRRTTIDYLQSRVIAMSQVAAYSSRNWKTGSHRELEELEVIKVLNNSQY